MIRRRLRGGSTIAAMSSGLPTPARMLQAVSLGVDRVCVSLPTFHSAVSIQPGEMPVDADAWSEADGQRCVSATRPPFGRGVRFVLTRTSMPVLRPMWTTNPWRFAQIRRGVLGAQERSVSSPPARGPVVQREVGWRHVGATRWRPLLTRRRGRRTPRRPLPRPNARAPHLNVRSRKTAYVQEAENSFSVSQAGVFVKGQRNTSLLTQEPLTMPTDPLSAAGTRIACHPSLRTLRRASVFSFVVGIMDYDYDWDQDGFAAICRACHRPARFSRRIQPAWRTTAFRYAPSSTPLHRQCRFPLYGNID